MTAPTLRWLPDATPPDLATILRALAEHYPIREGAGDGIVLHFAPAGETGLCRVRLDGDVATIAVSTPAMAMRAVGALLAGIVPSGTSREERSPFTTFGIMLDCSRNAVMTVDHLKQWFARLALLGYNMVMLYTEDTYELPGEPYFGYLRGRYTEDELRELDDVARTFGIELIPCIQTLGHLSQILKWSPYRPVRDTAQVLLAEEDETYALIDKMLGFWRSVYCTNRVHLGMDETHDLGRGAYLDKVGFRRGFDIFNEHLARVVELCRKHGLEPMIWSDMYFRMGSKTHDYYDLESQIPADVIEQIPAESALVYWDYYHTEAEFYEKLILRHRDMGHEPIMGSGVWTWGRVWHDQSFTETKAGPCIEACRTTGLKEIFFTMWGDDGGYCDFDSSYAGLAWCAEKAFAGEIDDARLAARYATVCGGDYAANLAAARLSTILAPPAILWDDPILLIYARHQRVREPKCLADASREFAAIAKAIEPHTDDRAAGNLHHAWLLARVLAAKTGLAERLLVAWASGDKDGLNALRPEIGALRDVLSELAESFRTVWFAHNKPHGFEAIQIRLAGQHARLGELDRRLADVIAGKVDTIPELDENPPAENPAWVSGSYRGLASASDIQ